MLLTRLFSILGTAIFVTAVAAAVPSSLFDGRTLAGWEGDLKWWRVQNGALTGGSTTEKIPHNYFLATNRLFQNFDLRLKLKLTGDPATGLINSGVQIRSLRVPNNTEMSGYQVDAGDKWWGKLYDESRRKKFLARATDEQIKRLEKPGEWNAYEIRCEGPKITLALNGETTVTYTEENKTIEPDGLIALQIHGNCSAEISFRNITLEALP